jgi:hypothetical protein
MVSTRINTKQPSTRAHNKVPYYGFISYVSTKQATSETAYFSSSCLQMGQDAFCASQGSMQLLWKECRHGNTRSLSFCRKSSRQTAHHVLLLLPSRWWVSVSACPELSSGVSRLSWKRCCGNSLIWDAEASRLTADVHKHTHARFSSIQIGATTPNNVMWWCGAYWGGVQSLGGPNSGLLMVLQKMATMALCNAHKGCKGYHS